MYSYTTYPSEPLLSAAAADLLYAKEENPFRAITEVSSMVNDGLVNIGDAGELASRFLWLLAKDSCVNKGFVWRSPIRLTNNGVQGDYELMYCKPVLVIKFLELLFGPNFWKKASKARKIFQDAYFNFSHWVEMGFYITRGDGGLNSVSYVASRSLADVTLTMYSIEEWTKSLWTRTSAIQCCHNQPEIDKVIPIYFMSNARGSRMSPILISNKARDRPQKKLLGKITRKHDNIAPNYNGPPYIVILADLGVPSSSLTVKDGTKKKDACIRIHAVGLNKETYPFLKDGIAQTLRDLYARQSVPSGPNFAEDLGTEV